MDFETQRGDADVRIGFDVGGTFTDFVLQRPDGTLVTDKRLTSSEEPVRAICAGLEAVLERAGVCGEAVEQLVHATTLGSNAALERRGPRVALLTTAGFRDVLHIQRSLRHRMYDVQIEKREPLIARSSIFEIGERLDARGRVVRALPEEEVRALARTLVEHGYESVAVCFLHAYAEPAHERRTRELLAEEAPQLLVTISSEVSLQGREYERTNTTVVNAYLGPVLGGYVGRLAETLPTLGLAAPLWMMQSSGGLTPAREVVTLPVRTIESGPAAGALMAAHHGRLAGREDVLSIDMGGTTAKAGVIRGGRPALTRSFELERDQMRKGSGLPLDIPAIDLVEIGTGGGSIAASRLGVLSVGPRSAGADPGPACYGRGGAEPTVTDANLLLGYLDADSFAGGTMRLDRAAAERAIGALGRELELDPLRAAWGVHEVATLEMERALRLVSIDQGLDPRDFAMVVFGGAAPAHGSRLARSLGVRDVIVPPAAGVGSALGLLEARESLELARTAIVRFDSERARDAMRGVLGGLEREARTIVGEAWGAAGPRLRRAVGLRFVGQGHELEVPIGSAAPELDELAEEFRRKYERTYGYREELPIEAVTWFVTALRDGGEQRAAEPPSAGERVGDALAGRRAAYFPESGVVEVDVLRRERLGAGERFDGPCLIEDAHTTTVVLPGDAVRIGADGTIHIRAPERVDA
ncbi:MAG: hydantoinase/oxoprolinase family protein [Solirubrobacteraceae bacterium]